MLIISEQESVKIILRPYFSNEMWITINIIVEKKEK